jgi:predicted nucleotidyltransferase
MGTPVSGRWRHAEARPQRIRRSENGAALRVGAVAGRRRHLSAGPGGTGRIRASKEDGCNTDGMELAPGVAIDDEVLKEFCRLNGVRRLGLFGSALRGELRSDSDVDLLVEFEPGRVPGLLHLAALELELAALLGRDVDLRTPADLSRLFREDRKSVV